MKFHVPDMSCGHCVATIEKAIKAADSAARVRPDLPSRTAEFDTSLPITELEQILKDAGYPSNVSVGGDRP